MMDNDSDNNSLINRDSQTLVVKYGGNAMRDENLQLGVMQQIALLKKNGHRVILVHGGGPFIAEVLDRAGVESEFIEGQRKTTPEAMPWIEMALKGRVNGNLVRLFQNMQVNAVGLSGKDGNLVTAEKLYLKRDKENLDLGRVGKVVEVNTALLEVLLRKDYLPVICCVAGGTDGLDLNVNADFFAAAVAGALKADAMVLLTDIDGLRKDILDPASHIYSITLDEIEYLIENEIVKGGMIPKLRACGEALNSGVRRCRILNGMKAEQIQGFMKGMKYGTEITKSYATTE